MSIPQVVHNIMAGEMNIIEGVLTDFPTPILPKIIEEPTREVLVNIHTIINRNMVSVASDLIDRFQTKMYSSISFSGTYQKQFLLCWNRTNS